MLDIKNYFASSLFNLVIHVISSWWRPNETLIHSTEYWILNTIQWIQLVFSWVPQITLLRNQNQILGTWETKEISKLFRWPEIIFIYYWCFRCFVFINSVSFLSFSHSYFYFILFYFVLSWIDNTVYCVIDYVKSIKKHKKHKKIY